MRAVLLLAAAAAVVILIRSRRAVEVWHVAVEQPEPDGPHPAAGASRDEGP